MKDITMNLDQFMSRYISKIRIDENTNCWTWIAATGSGGRPIFTIPKGETGAGTQIMVHRYVHILLARELEQVPEKGIYRPNCMNLRCINPEHNILTAGDNVKEIVQKDKTYCIKCGDKLINGKCDKCYLESFLQEYNKEIMEIAAISTKTRAIQYVLEHKREIDKKCRIARLHELQQLAIDIDQKR